ncbi:unnamed protein product, partial [Rotaria magnacalcarata]
VAGNMPHYLRTLVYASEPDMEWGPAKNENRNGRYIPKIDQSTSKYESDINNDGNTLATKAANIFHLELEL